MVVVVLEVVGAVVEVVGAVVEVVVTGTTSVVDVVGVIAVATGGGTRCRRSIANQLDFRPSAVVNEPPETLIVDLFPPKMTVTARPPYPPLPVRAAT